MSCSSPAILAQHVLGGYLDGLAFIDQVEKHLLGEVHNAERVLESRVSRVYVRQIAHAELLELT